MLAKAVPLIYPEPNLYAIKSSARYPYSFLSTQEGKGLPTRSHANQLRTGRHSQSGQLYLLTAVTHMREPVFSD